jgi:hypothetical protein
VTPAEAKADLARWHARRPTTCSTPTVCRLYDARHSEHGLHRSRRQGRRYGAIDNTPSTRLADVETAKNYLVAVLDEIAAGKPVAVAATRAYGCSIKYRGA